MRIRKNAVKILSSAQNMYWFLPPTNASPASAIDFSPQSNICKLNCSPWDVMPVSPDLSSCNHQFQEDRKENEGVEQNNPLNEEEPKPILVSNLHKEEVDMKKRNEEIRNKKRENHIEISYPNETKKKRKNVKEIEKRIVATANTIKTYKKNNEANWQYKQDAQDSQSHSYQVLGARGRNSRTIDMINTNFVYDGSLAFIYSYGKRRRGDEDCSGSCGVQNVDGKHLKMIDAFNDKKHINNNDGEGTGGANGFNDRVKVEQSEYKPREEKEKGKNIGKRGRRQ